MDEFWCEGCGDRFDGVAPIQITELYVLSEAVQARAALEESAGRPGPIPPGATERVLHFTFHAPACYRDWQAREVRWKTEDAAL